MKLTANEGHAETKLHAAAWHGDISAAQELIDEGYDVNVKDSIIETPLHGVAAWGHRKMIEFLIKQGANPNIKSNDGKCPIQLNFFELRTALQQSILWRQSTASIRLSPPPVGLHPKLVPPSGRT